MRGKNVTIEYATVECDGVALYANHNCSGLTVRNCTFISHAKNAVHIIADKIGGKIESVLFENCTFIGYRMGVELQNHGTPVKPPAGEDVPEDWYKINDVEFLGCSFQTVEGTTDRGYALSLTGYGKNVSLDYCSFNGRVKGVEIAGFSDVTLQGCKIQGGKESLIASNDRLMRNITARSCELKGKVYLENASESNLSWCKVEALCVYLKNSATITLNGNDIRSTGSYGVMMDQSRECLVIDNTITQRGSNYSIVRCYGKNAIGNIVRGNALSMKKPKKGKWYDQTGKANVGFAKGNVFEANSQKYI